MGATTNDMPSGAGDGVRWSQTKEDVDITVELPEGVKARDLNVTIKSKAVRVALKSGDQRVLLDVPELNAQVHTDDSTWTVGSDGLTITLEKAIPAVWHVLGLGHDGIDGTGPAASD